MFNPNYFLLRNKLRSPFLTTNVTKLIEENVMDLKKVKIWTYFEHHMYIYDRNNSETFFMRKIHTPFTSRGVGYKNEKIFP